MSMYTKEIHPGDKMLVDNFGKHVGFEPQDFSKVKEEEVCSKKACENDVEQSTCYRAFKGDIQNPEKGCQGYQRRTMGKKIGKSKKASKITSGNAASKISQKTDDKPIKNKQKNALDDGPLGLENIENSVVHATAVSAGKKTTAPNQDSVAAIAGIGGAAVIGGLAMNTLADDDSNNVTPGNNGGIHAMFAPAASTAGFSTSLRKTIPPAAACVTEKSTQALGLAIKKAHIVEMKTLSTAPVAGSKNPQASHQTFYNLIVAKLTYLATIKDLEQLNSGIDLLIGHVNILIGTNSIRSHFSQKLANQIISAVSCIQNIGTPLSICQSIGWLAESMKD